MLPVAPQCRDRHTQRPSSPSSPVTLVAGVLRHRPTQQHSCCDPLRDPRPDHGGTGTSVPAVTADPAHSHTIERGQPTRTQSFCGSPSGSAAMRLKCFPKKYSTECAQVRLHDGAARKKNASPQKCLRKEQREQLRRLRDFKKKLSLRALRSASAADTDTRVLAPSPAHRFTVISAKSV